MVIDTSAVIAILRREPDADALLDAIAGAEALAISAVSLLEASMVLAGGRDTDGEWPPLDDFIASAEIEIVPFGPNQARLARQAFARWGKGRHPAGLNLGDCCAYALAVERRAQLLFKGADFVRTDIVPALPPVVAH
ncbi:MAG: type II toxin-antitoxin system VapC family toxin [Alphaproteobacteria bacterium]|nr:type II toxin-antitoxin system VapC family toxin [Alphaproteobacteria bacterium]